MQGFTTLFLIEIIALLSGVGLLYFEYRKDKILWIFSLISSVTTAYIYIQSEVYFTFALSLVYLLLSVKGLGDWYRKKNEEALSIKKLNNKKRVLLLCITIFLIAVLLPLKIYFDTKGFYVNILDVSYFSISLIGLWLLVRCYIDNWFYWIVANFIGIPLNFELELYYMILFFILAFIISILGYFNWKKMYIEKSL